jgi:hypothetical protein
MSLSSRPHALGRGIGCLMCEAARREQAQHAEGAVAQGLQTTVSWTRYANLTREVCA